MFTISVRYGAEHQYEETNHLWYFDLEQAWSAAANWVDNLQAMELDNPCGYVWDEKNNLVCNII